jgi:hypothetical protein
VRFLVNGAKFEAAETRPRDNPIPMQAA